MLYLYIMHKDIRGFLKALKGCDVKITTSWIIVCRIDHKAQFLGILFMYLFIFLTGMKTAIARNISSTCSSSPLWQWGRRIICGDSDCLEHPQQEVFLDESQIQLGTLGITHIAKKLDTGQFEVIFKKGLSKFFVVKLTHHNMYIAWSCPSCELEVELYLPWLELLSSLTGHVLK